jgi:hypothetical protein
METAAARMDGRWAAKKPETVDGGRRRPMDEEDGAADVMEDGDRRRADGWTVGREKTGNGGRRMATDDG